jgi:hypothetical protein
VNTPTVEDIIAQYPEALDDLMYDVLVLHKNFPGAELAGFAQRNPEHQHLCGLIQYIRATPAIADMLESDMLETTR